MLDQEFIAMSQILESGLKTVSPHVRWLIRHAVTKYAGCNPINQIAYWEKLPVAPNGEYYWGEAYAPAKSMAINLKKHFDSCLKKVMSPKNMNTGLRLFIVRELLDTAIHEAHHLKMAYETGDFNNSNLEEAEAKAAGLLHSWMAAKYWDVEVTVFGPVLDALLEDIVQTWREDLADGTPCEWKELQLYMWDKGLSFYDPEKPDNSLLMRDTMESMAKDPNRWSEDAKPFMVTIVEEEDDLQQKEDVPTTQVPVQEAVPPEPQAAPIQEPAEDKYVDESVEKAAADYEVPLPPTDDNVVPPAPEAAAAVPQPPQVDNTAKQIQRSVELVMRRAFVHIFTKCGFNTEGGYNNPNAVLDPINIADIPGALELFSHMDTLDNLGVYSPKVPCQGFLKGLIDDEGKPYYRFFLKISNAFHERSFLVQNPNKLDYDTKELTNWAIAARDGARIMALNQKKVGHRFSLKLDPDMPFGQEEFKIWPVKQEQTN